MLRLATRTPHSFGSWALDHLHDILVDHAQCEKKAASTALGLLFRYPDVPALQHPLSALAREELEHFECVLDHLARMQIPLVRQKPSAYASTLMAAVATFEPQRLVDTLLCCALIEARSCERMQLLAQAFERSPLFGPAHQLTKLYRGLLASEARHHQSYVDLAIEVAETPASAVMHRLETMAQAEAHALVTAQGVARLHSGPVTGIAPEAPVL